MTRSRTAGAALALAFAALAIAPAFAQGGFQPPPSPTRHVTDDAGFISESTRRALTARLEKYQRDTGRQVIVWIAPSLGREQLEDFTVRTAQAWGVGGKEDDGVALFVFAEDRKLRLEVGYGAEGTIPDAVANQIIEDVIVPRLRAGNPDQAITAGVSAILERLGGEEDPPQGVAPAPVARTEPRQRGNPILFGIVAAIFLVLFITNPRLAILLLFSMMSGGRGGGFGGGGGGGGGGFRGGGGRFGGGGASGSW